MRKITLLFIISLFVSFLRLQAQDWTQLGMDINGQSINDLSGWAVSLSDDGSVVAIGAPNNEDNSSGPGYVRIFQNNSGTWTQIGQDIYGNATDDWFGYSVSLNSDGSVVAIGAPYDYYNNSGIGYVRVYYNNSGIWTQVGTDIIGDVGGRTGLSVNLSADGSIVAIGSPGNDINGNDAGRVRIFQYTSETWTQIGQDIYGDEAEDSFGWAISLNSDGTIVAIGAPGNDENGINTGQVRVFENNSGLWTQIGQGIGGIVEHDWFGYSVSLNSDASTVAVGAPKNDSNGSNAGQVRVFENNSGIWTQIGQGVDGKSSYDWLGYSVSLNSDGSIVAIGAPNDIGSEVLIYQNNSGSWSQIGQDLYEENAGDRFGSSVDLNSDGSIVVIGAPHNGGNGYYAGHVRIFQNLALDISELKKAGIYIYPNPSNGEFTIENAKDYEIIITDITGKIVYQANKAEDIVNRRVRLRQSGIYIINFTSKTKNFSSKIIVK